MQLTRERKRCKVPGEGAALASHLPALAFPPPGSVQSRCCASASHPLAAQCDEANLSEHAIGLLSCKAYI